MKNWNRSWTILVGLAAALGASGAAAQSFPELDAARQAVAASPNNAEAQYRLGLALLEARELNAARGAFDAALRQRADWVDALWGIARARMAEGNYDDSRNACRKVIAAAGQAAASGHVCMGQAYLVWRRSSLAIEEFDKALAAEASNAEAHAGRGDAHARANEVDQALAEYQAAVNADGNLVEARIGLALMTERKGDKAGAIQQLEAAVAARSWSAEAHYHLGRLTADDAQAIEHLAQAVAIRPSFTDAQTEYGKRLIAVGRYADAVAPLQAAQTQLPNVASINELLGIALWKTSQFADAEARLRAAIQGVPNAPRANEALGEVLIATDRFDDGLGYLQTAANLEASNIDILLRIAELLRSKSRNTLATGFLERAIRVRQNLSRAHLLYGDILFDQGRYTEARTSYESALSGDGVGIDSAYVQGRLQQVETLAPRPR